MTHKPKTCESFGSSKVEQKRQIINFVLTNLQLKGKKLEYTLKTPFDVLVLLQIIGKLWLTLLQNIIILYLTLLQG